MESQPEPQPGQIESDQHVPSKLEEQEEELRPWVHKPFAAVIGSLRQVKGEYIALEKALHKISKELKVEPLNMLNYVKKLPKAQDMAELQAQVDCLLMENMELKT